MWEYKYGECLRFSWHFVYLISFEKVIIVLTEAKIFLIITNIAIISNNKEYIDGEILYS
ncbi:hypothetical protein JCM37173_30980 [Allocoprococcus similis]